MESLNYAFEGRGFMFSDTGLELPVDSFSRNRNLLKEWNLSPLSPNHHEIDGGEEFIESGLAEMLQKSPVSSPGLRLSSTETDNLDNHDHQSSKSSNLQYDTNKAVLDNRVGAKSNQSSKKSSDLSSVEPCVTVKKARLSSCSSQVFVCQVQGCNQDLSSSKDYHKRHRVCDEHSKTPKVIVNGIEQRFCQQCSRFHLLVEFDDDKRSCRKRLAGHNERRRKPHRDIDQWDIAGSKLFDLATERSISFLIPEILNAGYFSLERYEESKQSFSSRFNPEQPRNRLGESFTSREFPSVCSHSLLSAQNENVPGDSPCISAIHPATTGLTASSDFTSSDHQFDAFGLVLEDSQMDGNPENLSYYVPPESVPTIDLQQLSSNLLRVEQQRSYAHAKLDCDNMFI